MNMKTRLASCAAVTTALIVLLVVPACKPNVGEMEQVDTLVCYESMVEVAREDPSSEVAVEELFRTYCGSEHYGDVEIVTDAAGYKSQVRFIHEGMPYKRLYSPDLRAAMEWLRNNTPNNARVVAWWDYGGMIRVFAEKAPVVTSPSRGTLAYAADYLNNQSEEFIIETYQKLDDDQLMKNVALILTNDDPAEAIKLMEELDAQYLLIPLGSEIAKFPVIYEFAHGKFKSIENEYQHVVGLEEEEIDRISVTYKAYKNEPITGFKRVYSDEHAVIYEIA